MLELARYRGRKRATGSAALAVGLGALTAMYVAMFPSIASATDLDELAETYPPALQEAFGIAALNTIEGFLATQLYAFAWVILLGLYFTYAAASLVSGDVERGRLDMTLSLPVTRTRVLLEGFASLAVPLVVLNAFLPVVVLVSTAAVGESISAVDVLVVHFLSLPYLLACASIGLLASVRFDRASIAQRVGVGVVFALFLVNSVVAGTDYEMLGRLTPMYYYDPTAILVDGSYDVVGAVVLLGYTAIFVVISRQWFLRRDV